MGQTHYALYRIVVVDQRAKRDGRVIEEVGTYNPNTNPSTITVESERIQYWLGVGAQPSDPVRVILKITGDWQKFKGLPGAEGTLKTVEKKASAQEAVDEVEKKAEKLKADKAAAAEKAAKEAEAAKAAEESESSDAEEKAE